MRDYSTYPLPHELRYLERKRKPRRIPVKRLMIERLRRVEDWIERVEEEGKRIIYEDELPEDITKAEYDYFYDHSVVDGVRYMVIE